MQPSYRPTIEPLEQRDLMAASLTASVSNAILTIQATESPDAILLTQKGVSNGSTFVSVDWSIYKAVRILGQGGDDIIKTDFASFIPPPLFFYGGEGNDRLFGTANADYLYGDGGMDKLYGGGGNDWLYGGNDNDFLFGQAGSDHLYGDAGDDWLEAGSAAEAVQGGTGLDVNAYLWAINGATATDVDQTHSDRCVILASLASAADAGVDLSSRISYLGNFLYRVKLFDASANQWVGVDVTFDGTLANTSAGAVVDAQPHEAVDTTADYWTLLYQRAYVQHFYATDPMDGDAVSALPGEPDHVRALQSVTGWETQQVTFWTSQNGYSMTTAQLGTALQDSLAHGDVLTVGGTGHAYAIVDVFQEAGVWKVTLYNPWGHDAVHIPNANKPDADAVIPFQNDGVNDGLITMDLSTLRQDFRYFTKAIRP